MDAVTREQKEQEIHDLQEENLQLVQETANLSQTNANLENIEKQLRREIGMEQGTAPYDHMPELRKAIIKAKLGVIRLELQLPDVQAMAEVERNCDEYVSCPMNRRLLRNPVRTAAGTTYSDEAIREWWKTNPGKDPTSNANLATTDLSADYRPCQSADYRPTRKYTDG